MGAMNSYFLALFPKNDEPISISFDEFQHISFRLCSLKKINQIILMDISLVHGVWMLWLIVRGTYL